MKRIVTGVLMAMVLSSSAFAAKTDNSGTDGKINYNRAEDLGLLTITGPAAQAIYSDMFGVEEANDPATGWKTKKGRDYACFITESEYTCVIAIDSASLGHLDTNN